jgi:glycosyltransferase involved in cell wall biosynthesis
MAKTMVPRVKTLLSLNGFHPVRVGSLETFERNLSLDLAKHDWRHVICYASAPAEPVRRFLDLPNVEFAAIPNLFYRHWRPTLAMARLLRRYRPDILYMQLAGLVSLYPWLAKFYGARQVVYTDQASRPEGFALQPAPWWRRLVTRALAAPVNPVTCISDYVLQCCQSARILPAARFLRIYNSVDVTYGATDGAEFRRRHGIPLDCQVVAQISAMIPDKGFDDLLEAARLVLLEDPTVHFLMAGVGPHLERYKELTASLGLTGRITFTGRVEEPLAEGFFAAADILCQVSRWEEGFGLSIAEGMSAGKPFIGTRAGAIPELVRDGETGFLVERRAPDQLAARILQLLRDPILRRKFGEAGRQLAIREFNQQKSVPQFMQLFGF